MIRRTFELAGQVVCVTAMAVWAVEGGGELHQRKREIITRVLQFKEHLQSSSLKVPSFLADVAFSEIVVGWLVDQMLATANDYEILEDVD